MISYDYYRIFYYVAQYHSFTRAAEILESNQPNITRCINNLEHDLNCRLFVRSNRGVTMTPEGQMLYRHISKACEQFQIGEEEIKKNQALENGLISVGASETALRLMFLDRLETFHEQYPRVRLRISNHSTPQAIAALESGLVDFAVVTTPLNIRKPLQKTSLYEFQEILIGGPKYENTAQTVCQLHDLKEIPFISLGEGTGTRELYIHYFLDHGIPFQPDMEAATTDQILPMAEHNLGIGFFPEKLAAEALAQGKIVQIPLAGPLPTRHVCLVHNTQRPLSFAAKKLKQMLCGTN